MGGTVRRGTVQARVRRLRRASLDLVAARSARAGADVGGPSGCGAGPRICKHVSTDAAVQGPPGAHGSTMARLGWIVCLACLAAPWLNPLASGPSSSVNPWLFGALCMAVIYAIQQPAVVNAAVIVGLAGIGAWAVLVTGFTSDAVALAAACLLIFMAAGLAAAGLLRPRIVHAMALAWLLAATASTAIALAQYFGVSEGLAPWVNASAAGEAFANLRQRNQFASLTVIGMASLFWLSQRQQSQQRHWLAIAAMAWLAVGNAATTSRTGLLQ